MTNKLLVFPLLPLLTSVAPVGSTARAETKVPSPSAQAIDASTPLNSTPFDPTQGLALRYPIPLNRDPNNESSPVNEGWKLVNFCTEKELGSQGVAVEPYCNLSDDDSAPFTLPFKFDFYGKEYDEVFINSNGNISFGEHFTEYNSEGFPVKNYPMIAPFWADVDNRLDEGVPPVRHGNIWFKEVAPNTIAVVWDNVGYYEKKKGLRNTFQVLLSDGKNPVMGIGKNVCFSYDDMQWTSGDAGNLVTPGFGHPATVGSNKGDGKASRLWGRFSKDNATFIGETSDDNGVHWLDGKTDCFDESIENKPPEAKNLPPNNIYEIECEQTLSEQIQFKSPETDQTTTISFQDLDGAVNDGLALTTTPGNPATIDFDWTPPAPLTGNYTIVLTAEDDFSPTPGTTQESITIKVTCPESPPIARCQDVTVEADDQCLGYADIDDGSEDPEQYPLSYDQNPSAPYQLGTTHDVTLTVTDIAGLTDSCTADVTVVDHTGPDIIFTQPHTYYLCNPDGEEVDIKAPQVEDACDPLHQLTVTSRIIEINAVTVDIPFDGSVHLPQGFHWIEWTATDQANNTTVAHEYIYVEFKGTEECCKDYADYLIGSDAQDHLVWQQPRPVCILGKGMGDAIYTTGTGKDLIIGDDGSDHIVGRPGGGTQIGGDGQDSFSVACDSISYGGNGGDHMTCYGPGDAFMFGGAGDDDIVTGEGHDEIIAGSGADTVNANGGDDDVYVYHVCELQSGDTFNGGPGYDTLHLPHGVTVSDLAGLGVQVSGFENYAVTASALAPFSDCI